jgi:hypothetical protein
MMIAKMLIVIDTAASTADNTALAHTNQGNTQLIEGSRQRLLVSVQYDNILSMDEISHEIIGKKCLHVSENGTS